jgi:ABC-type nitrate/sulfonate/bicarbonate transport system substrate-binding protein
MSRRRFLTLGAALLAAPRLPLFAARPARIQQAASTTEQSLAWIAAEAGIYRSLGLEVRFVPDEADLAQRALVQVAESALSGGDTVLVASPLEPNRGGFLMASAKVRGPEQLSGARVGVISAGGPSASAARAVLARANANATFVELRAYPAIYAALAAGSIDAGWLPVDLAFRGRFAHGWTTFPGVRLSVPGGFVSTRRAIARDREAVKMLVRGIVTAIHFFRNKPDEVVPLIQRYTQVEPDVAAALQVFYAPLFRAKPAPSLYFGLPALREALQARYPAAAHLAAEDLVDPSFV